MIGDDDLIDPDLVDALRIAIALKPGLDGFGWSNLKYDWAAPDAPVRNAGAAEATFTTCRSRCCSDVLSAGTMPASR